MQDRPPKVVVAVEQTDEVRSHRPTKKHVAPPMPKSRRRPPPEPPAPKSGLVIALAVGLALALAAVITLLVRGPSSPPAPEPEPPIAHETPDQPPPEPAAAKGEITVRTEPQAMVSVGDTILGQADKSGKAGPFALPGGTHSIRVALVVQGFERTRKIDVAPNKSYEIEIMARKGYIKVAVAPWARVKLNGKDKGVTPLPQLVVNEGTHHLVLTNKEIKRRFNTMVKVKPGEVSKVKVDLKELGERM